MRTASSPGVTALIVIALAAGAAGSITLVRTSGAADAAYRNPVIVAAGDIACPRPPCSGSRSTANLISNIDPTAVLALGDEQYPSGSLAHFRASYDRTWGAFLGRTFPVPGNHEYGTTRASGYFDYFGKRTFGTSGWYSIDVGSWHLVALNSRTGEAPGAAQLSWLERDLVNNARRCQLAFWHHPRFSSGREHGSNRKMAAFWTRLQAAGVDVVLNGHEHNYERFSPMLPSGRASKNGIREFVVGTGGIGSSYGFRSRPLATSRVRTNTIGVLRLELRAGSYVWKFVRPGGQVTDQGDGTCH